MQPHALAATDVGLVRQRQEDAYAVLPFVWVVADGMGGHGGGDEASRAAVGACVERLRRADPLPPQQLDEALDEAFAAAHAAVVAAGRDTGHEDMGTTLTVAAVDADGALHLRHAGDSRAYLFTDGALRQLTDDDNVAGRLQRAGRLTADQARVHPGQYMLTSALGLGREAAPEPQRLLVAQPAGVLLLCSDGLSGECDDDDITTVLTAEQELEPAAAALIDAALDAGGSDNITLVLVRLP